MIQIRFQQIRHVTSLGPASYVETGMGPGRLSEILDGRADAGIPFHQQDVAGLQNRRHIGRRHPIDALISPLGLRQVGSQSLAYGSSDDTHIDLLLFPVGDSRRLVHGLILNGPQKSGILAGHFPRACQ